MLKSLVHQNQHVLGQVSVSSYIKKDHYAWVGQDPCSNMQHADRGGAGASHHTCWWGGRGSPIYTESSGADGGTGGRGHGIRNTRLRQGILATTANPLLGSWDRRLGFPVVNPNMQSSVGSRNEVTLGHGTQCLFSHPFF